MGKRLLYSGLIFAMTFAGCSMQNNLIPKDKQLRNRNFSNVVQVIPPKNLWEVVGKHVEEEVLLHEQKTAGYNELGMPVSVHARAYDDTDLVLTLRSDGPKGPELRIIYLNDLEEYDSVIPKSFINLNDFDYNDNDPVFLDITVIELVDVPPVGQKV